MTAAKAWIASFSALNSKALFEPALRWELNSTEGVREKRVNYNAKPPFSIA